jgi:hypothetical protein
MHCFALEVPVLNIDLCGKENTVPLSLPHSVRGPPVLQELAAGLEWRGKRRHSTCITLRNLSKYEMKLYAFF